MEKEREGLAGNRGGGIFQSVERSFLIRAAVVHGVDHEEEVRPGRHQRVTGLHNLETHVVEGLRDQYCNEHTHTHTRKKDQIKPGKKNNVLFIYLFI